MSLLMKALEKAAKDRSEARPPQPLPESLQSSASPPPGMTPIPTPRTAPEQAVGKTELSLEPLSLDKAGTREAPERLHPEPEPAPAPPSALGLEPDAPRSPPSEPVVAPATTPARMPESAREQERAATVLQAKAVKSTGVMVYLRTHPLVVFGAFAALFAIGFGVYIYLQIFHPALFLKQPPAMTSPPLVQAPAPIPSGAVLPPSIPEPAPAVSTPVATAPRPAPKAPLRALPTPQPVVTAEPAMPRNSIVVSPGSAALKVNPLLTDAYRALQANRFDESRGLYEQLLKAEPQNIDALLGLAAIAVERGRNEDATQHYMKILELDPRHALAQAGLIALLGRADPLAAESRLQQLIARDPSAFLYFTLGNLYADQSQWAQAQQAYFQAYHLEPSNPDYAYNLAVGLEHVSQEKLALGFYRQALALAAKRPHVNFNHDLAQERIVKLASRVE